MDGGDGEQRATVKSDEAREQATFHLERPLRAGPATIP